MNNRRLRNVVSTICAAALVCAATGTLAQTVHRQLDAEGRTTFSDLTDATPASPAEAAPAAEPTRVRKSHISPRVSAMVEAKEAQRRLRQARLARERGAEPLPSERVRGAGPQAVNHRYWQRQEKLRLEAELALRRVNETQRSVYASR